MGYLQAKCFKKWSHRLDAEGNDDDEAISWTKVLVFLTALLEQELTLIEDTC